MNELRDLIGHDFSAYNYWYAYGNYVRWWIFCLKILKIKEAKVSFRLAKERVVFVLSFSIL